MKKLLLPFVILSVSAFMIKTTMAQEQEFVYQQWAGSSGTQNFFYKNITKTDASQNIYTAGATLNGNGNYDLLLVKYNKSGVVQWTKQYDGAGGGHDMATGIHIDGSGNVYVTGTTYVNGTNYNDIVTIKYNSSGTQQWLSTYNGSGSSYDAGGGIIVDGAGTYVYICGGAMTTSNLSDFVAIKYAVSNGAQQWANTYNYNGNYDVATKLSISGTSLSVSGGVQYNSTTWKYATTGFLLSTGYNSGAAIVSGNNTGTLDELGDVFEDASQTYTYVCGSVNNTGTGTGYDYKIAKLLNSNLTVVWQRTWNGADSLADKAADIVVDASGNVYVTGFTTTDTQGKNYATVKYNSSGTLQWTKYHNGAGNGIDEATAINLDASNNVYVTGTSHTGGSQDYYTIKYKPDNTVVWEQAYNGLYNGLDKAYDIAVNPSTNEIAVSGQTQTATGYSYTTVSIGQATTVTNPNEVFNSSFSFTQNLGQLLKSNGTSASNIKYYNFSSAPTTYFSDTTVSYVLSSIDTLPATNDTLHRVDRTYTGHKTPGQYGINKRSDYYNFYLAHIPEGRAHVTNYNRLITPELYSKIDVLYTGNGKGLVTSFVCKPTSTPAASIKMKFSGADSIRIVNNDLIIYTKLGQIKHPRATAYELDNNGTAYVLGWFPTYVRSGNEITFTLGAYNTARNLIIDMGFGTASGGGGSLNNVWSTYLGGSAGNDFCELGDDVANDGEGNVYATGGAASFEFPTTVGAFDQNFSGWQDAFVTKFSPVGKLLISTFVGGSNVDWGNSIEINSVGRIIILGTTQSDFNFPTFFAGNGEYQQATMGNNAPEFDRFIVMLKPDMTERIWSTYLGGNGDDYQLWGKSLSLDNNNNIYVNVQGNSTDLDLYTVTSAYNQSTPGPSFLIKFNPIGVPIWSSYFPAMFQSIDVDGYGHIFGVGRTNRNTADATTCAPPTTGGFPLCDVGGYYQNVSGSTNDGTDNEAFIVEFNSSYQLIWSTYFGGNGYDDAIALKVEDRTLYVLGTTNTQTGSGETTPCAEPGVGEFPTCDPGSSAEFHNTLYGTSGYADLFIAKFSLLDYNLKWSTYFGGDEGDYGYTIVTDPNQNIYIAGKTNSSDFKTEDPGNNFYFDNDLDQTPGSQESDPFLAAFSSSGVLFWSTYYGGANPNFQYCEDESAYGLSIFQDDKLYMTGITGSTSFPYRCTESGNVQYCRQTLNQGELTDAFMVMFDLNGNTTIGVNEPTAENPSGILVYPNPSNHLLNIEYFVEHNSELNICLFDIVGNLVYEMPLSKTQTGIIHKTIDVSLYRQGIYILRVINNGQSFSKKIIIK